MHFPAADAVASLWKTTFPLRTARTEQSFGNFLAQYLATEADERIVWCLAAVPTITLLASHEFASRTIILRTDEPRQIFSLRSTYRQKLTDFQLKLNPQFFF